MSAAASQHQIEEPQVDIEELPEPENESSLSKLRSLAAPPFKAILAVDLDDVLCCTNEDVALWHNEVYGTNMTVHDFYYYYYWKNPYWGDLQTTMSKVRDYYATGRIFTQTRPVSGAREGVQTLKDMNYRLVVVTARSPDTQDQSWEWLDLHFPGIFDSIICTGQFKDSDKRGHEVATKLTKAQVCADLGAIALIDDSSENALQAATAGISGFTTLLFGDYSWNKRVSRPEDTTNAMAFDARLSLESGREFWKEENLKIPPDIALHRVKDWGEVIRWIKANEPLSRETTAPRIN